LGLAAVFAIALAAKAGSLPGRGPEGADQTPAFDIIVGWTLVVAHGDFRAAPRAPYVSVPQELFFMNRLSKARCLSYLARKPAVLEKRAFH